NYVAGCGAAPSTLVEVVTFALLGQWLLSYALERIPYSRFSLAFARANQQACVSLLAAVLIGLHLPSFALDASGVNLVEISLPCRVLVMAWCFDAARRYASSLL